MTWNVAEFQHLLQRYRNTYHEPETPEDIDRKLLRIMDYVSQLLSQTRIEERQWQAQLPNELEARITDVINRAIKEAAAYPDGQELIRENATTCLRNCTRLAMAERDRQARLDEHNLLAGLDEEGKKKRYLELAKE